MNVDICMMVHDDVIHDSRIRREAGSLAAQGWKVVVVCIALGNTQLPDVQEIHGYTIWRVSPRIFRNRRIRTIGKLIQLLTALPVVFGRLRQANARVYHAHDFTGLLMVALAGIWRRPVVYDSHELFFDRTFLGMPRGVIALLRSLRPLEKLLARRAVKVIATCDGHAGQLVKNLDIAYPVIVRNAVDLRTLGDIAVRYTVSTDKIMAHTGNLFRARHLPEQIEALGHLPDDVGLVFMGSGPLRDELLAQAEAAGLGSRFQIVPPVPPDSIAPTLAQAHVALVLVESDSLSHHYALPNKFFEAVAAGIPLVIAPTPEVERLVKEYDIGLTCNAHDPLSIADAVRTVLEPDNYQRLKANVQRARSEITWANEEQKLFAIYEGLLNRGR